MAGSLNEQKNSPFAPTFVNGEKLILAKPTTFMNESGLAVQQLVRKHDLETLDALLIIHDELDLKPGTLKVKLHGGLAGHNGLKSISKHLKSNDLVVYE